MAPFRVTGGCVFSRLSDGGCKSSDRNFDCQSWQTLSRNDLCFCGSWFVFVEEGGNFPPDPGMQMLSKLRQSSTGQRNVPTTSLSPNTVKTKRSSKSGDAESQQSETVERAI